MTGTYCRLDDHEARKRIADFQAAAGDLQPVFKAFGEYMLLQTDERFSGEHAPDGSAWQELSPATLKTKKGSKILTETTMMRGSVVYTTSPTHMAYGSNKIYYAIHQFGGQAGRGLKVTIPQRESLGFNDADLAEFTDTARDHMEAK
jgi:phage virion morphogenesis protein